MSLEGLRDNNFGAPKEMQHWAHQCENIAVPPFNLIVEVQPLILQIACTCVLIRLLGVLNS